jgi:hypothetical protein
MIFNCYGCKLNFHAEKFNVARVTISCPTCATNLNIAQSITRTYGKVIGEQVSKIMQSLEKLMDKSKSGDLSTAISLSQRRIESLCEGQI